MWNFTEVQFYTEPIWSLIVYWGVTIILVYVHDMLITGDNLELIEETKISLQNAFKMKDVGELKYFLSIEFAKSKQRITMH